MSGQSNFASGATGPSGQRAAGQGGSTTPQQRSGGGRADASPGARRAPRDGLVQAERVTSRSADPGQSSYGGFSGEGGARRQPKGYVRSDASLRDSVCERLAQLAHADVSEVSVDVKDGVVTLSGTVPRRDMKHAIEDCVDSVLGVRDIENRVRVPRA